MAKRTKRPIYSAEQIRRDLQARGWLPTDLAEQINRSPTTISRFLDGTQQNPRVAKLIAAAFGEPLERYLTRKP